MRILLTNDDGINARGLHSLINELNTIAEIYVVAPRSEQSGTGHSITVFDPIKAIETKIPGIKKGWLVGGHPSIVLNWARKDWCPNPSTWWCPALITAPIWVPTYYTRVPYLPLPKG